jgi:hypothetical protein
MHDPANRRVSMESFRSLVNELHKEQVRAGVDPRLAFLENYGRNVSSCFLVRVRVPIRPPLFVQSAHALDVHGTWIAPEELVPTLDAMSRALDVFDHPTDPSSKAPFTPRLGSSFGDPLSQRKWTLVPPSPPPSPPPPPPNPTPKTHTQTT